MPPISPATPLATAMEVRAPERLAFWPLHVVPAPPDSPSGRLEMKLAASTGTPIPPPDSNEYEHDRRGDTVVKGAERDRGSRAFLLPWRGCWSSELLRCAAPCQRDVCGDVGTGADEEAVGVPVGPPVVSASSTRSKVDEVEGECGDEHACTGTPSQRLRPAPAR